MKTFKLAQIQIMLLAVFALTQNCSDVNFAELDPTNDKACVVGSSEEGCGEILPPGPEPGRESKSAEFTQPAANTTNLKLDILFVTDTSSSLKDERGAVAAGLSKFIDGNFTDVRVAVLFGHIKSKYAGKLYKCIEDECQNDVEVLNSNSYNFDDPNELASFQSHLENKLNNVKDESVSDGGEALLIGVNKLLEPANLDLAKRQGFFRDDAALAVIFISDENDICSYEHYPTGISPVTDKQVKEVPAYETYCVDDQGNRIISPQSTLANLKLAKGSNQVILSGVYYIDPQLTPSGGENEVSYGLVETVGLSIGVDESNIHTDAGRALHKKFAIELAEESVGEDSKEKIKEGLEYLGGLTKSQLQLKTSFDILLENGEKLSSGPVIAYVDDQQVQAKAVTYDHGQYFTVFIDSMMAGQAESKISINYSVDIY